METPDNFLLIIYITIHSYFTSVGPAPGAFSEAPLTVEIESKRIPNSPCYLPEKHCNKQPDRKRLCRSTSYDKPSRSSCHLQVITEADEENEEEETKEQLEVTNF